MNKTLYSATSALALGLSAPAWAQTVTPPVTPAAQDTTAAQTTTEDPAPATLPTGAEPTQDIVVTGIRRSLQDARALKRDSIGISDAISSEDIGKFPDQNLAESLQRVTGVQITRNKGEGSRVALRGLGPSFTQTLYNGRQIATPGGGRSFSFTSLSSDFVSAVEVLKSPTAEMVEGGLAGSVNVRVARPLDAGRNVVAVTAEGIYEENPKMATPHASLYVNHVFSDSFGVNFGVNYERRGVLQAGFFGYGAELGIENRRNPPRDYNRDGDLNDQFRFDHTTNLVAQDGTFERKTVIGGVQFKPTDTLNLYADGFYSDFQDNSIYNEHQVRFTNIQGPNSGIVGSANDGSFLTFLDADGVDHRSDTRVIRTRDKLYTAAVGGIWKNGPLTVSSEFTFSKGDRNAQNYGFGINSRASASYDLRDGIGNQPNVAFNRGYDPLNPSTFNLFSFGGDYNAPSSDRNYDGRLDAKYAFDGAGFSGAFKVGGMFANRKSSFSSSNFNINSTQLASALGQTYNPTIEGGSTSASQILSVTDYSKFVGDSLGRYLAPDLDKFFSLVPLSRVLEISPATAQPARDYAVTERSFEGYAQLDVKAFDNRLNANAGLRVVHTDQTSTGFAADLTSLFVRRGGVTTVVQRTSPVAIDNSYTEFLPSLNLSYNVTDSLKARFAAGRTLTRPDLGLLSPSISVDANTRAINATNPNLKPYLSSQLDLSLEYYFGGSGLLSAAVFYKDVKNFIVRTNSPAQYTVQLEEGGTLLQDFTLFQPRNGASSKIKGFELGAQVPFTFLPGALDGFGVIANFTYLDLGDVVVTQDQPAIPISGASTRSYNIAGYYEKYGFGLRASYNYRNGFVNDPRSTFGDGDYQRAYGQLDISASYDVTKKFSLNADITNATNAKTINVTNIGLLRNVLDVGRRYTAGVRFRF
ncbi:TonB-dependent receptor [Sphingomonas echinoides]|uniref:TonB-dependent receptor n=1 Tax=Sphingomonas echinoides TaxID=59803 RepID=UPI0024133F33|nr:TonB-dependent receptor [Sphingomonas echinoides]